MKRLAQITLAAGALFLLYCATRRSSTAHEQAMRPRPARAVESWDNEGGAMAPQGFGVDTSQVASVPK